MATGITDYPDSVDIKKFYGNRTGWEAVLPQLSSDVAFKNLGPPMSPQNISNVIASLYCNKSSGYGMAEGGNVSFVIFTSYSTAAPSVVVLFDS
ncbi:unnamed protein product [Anisakis simplex]|uniref:Aminotran_5 domain-containing protein n=1 Tax=Anisakis simplex TaxID=6269 RepID=A0A0M3JHG5_ANISI|nr:unnamed protein product [Anisakis simplex]